MSLDPKWVPMKWPCGPLESARRSKAKKPEGEVNAKNPEAGISETFSAWTKPAALDILKGTSINCLVVAWADGAPEDTAQQAALKPLIEAGRGKGISFVGKVATKDVAAAAASAKAAGLSALILAESPGRDLELPVILQPPRDKVVWAAATPIFSVTDNEWPGVRMDSMKGDTAVAGPTGVPWVNSNAWFSLLAAELAPGKIIWLDFDPPEESSLAHPANYSLAVSDSGVYGSRWIISLDDKLREALLKGTPQAMATWSKTCETVAFFEAHPQWRGYKPQGILTVISDFHGDNGFVSGETLNLLNRRHVQFKVMERSKALAGPMPGVMALLWLDKDPPTADQATRSLAFVRHGGLLIASNYWGPAGVKATRRDPSIDYKVYNVGQGQIAVPDEGFQDPYQVALDTQLLVSRRNDLARLYNPATTNCHCSFDPIGRKRLVQILNYSASPANFVTLWVNTRSPAARFWNCGTEDSKIVKGVSAAPGTDFGLPTITISSALEIEV
jgi:hypothetical protein